MTQKQQEAETAALARAILNTEAEIRRLEAQVAGMWAANMRRGVELAKRVGSSNGALTGQQKPEKGKAS